MEERRNHTNKCIQLINIDGTLINYQKSTAKFFNNYLTAADKINSDFKKDKSSLNGNNPIHCVYGYYKLLCSNMKIKYTTPKGTEKIMRSLKCENSHGYGGIYLKILKVSTPFITSLLTYICNKSLSLGIFPSRLKFSVIKPLHKKGDRSVIQNFRHISLLTSF